MKSVYPEGVQGDLWLEPEIRSITELVIERKGSSTVRVAVERRI